MKKTILLLGTMLAAAQVASAQVNAFAFEFETPGVDEDWQHNGATNGGSSDITGPTAVTVAGTGEGVLTGQQLPGNGDLRVLYNPDLTLDTGAFSSWNSIEIRFRQLDGLAGSPQTLTGATSGMHLGINTAAIFVDGSAFTEEVPSDPEFWYTATLDITGLGTADITQIRIDPIGSLTQNYELDYVRVTAIAVPEPGTFALISGALALGFIMVRRRR